MTASPLSTQVRPGTSELINIFKNVNLIECGAVLNIPNISTIDSTNLIPTNHIKGWAKVSLGGKVVRLSNVSERTSKRRILRIIHPDLNLNSVKSQAASQAIDELYQKIEIWREQGRRKADVAKLSAKAINIQAKRDKIRNEKARQAVEENIKSILLSSAGKEITYADMIRIWQECLIEGIMTQ